MTNRPSNSTMFSNTSVTQGPTRRTFLIAGASAAAFFAVRSTMAHAIITTPGTVTLVQFSDAGKPTGKVAVAKVVRPDAEWKQKLAPISYDVTRREGTERPYTGSTWDNHAKGFYRCICCDNAIFSSDTKFESGTGWPSFWQPIAKENIVEKTDMTLGMERTAVSCRECDAHLGHVFDDGPRPTGLRYCMNSAAMRFVKTA